MRVRPCIEADFEALYAIINNAAEAYRGIIPADRWNVPYMGRGELSHEIAAGVVFWCCKEKGELIGVMGLQDVEDVTLIRHAYVDTTAQRRGVGGTLLDALLSQSERPFLVGTWAAAAWAIRFYEKHGFRLMSVADKDRLLKRYWNIPERQVETSVVLADDRWRSAVA
jgi:N-acetylglutamate synthase-like GNAT family acetyltransferase